MVFVYEMRKEEVGMEEGVAGGMFVGEECRKRRVGIEYSLMHVAVLRVEA